ncbi:hypothetical protein EIP86_009531 [Pleurotus ostreatoroseus]|nr:hypothetical protein EIP86_009531 [Pleurotus ostreatoroseus]
MPTTLNRQLRHLRNAIVNKPPYRSGTVPVDRDELVVYYSKGEDESARRINLGTASAASLEHLAKTCDAATFGRNDQDVLDVSYRKAGKLDRPNFAVGLDVETSGLMDIVRGQLLEGREAQQSIHAELYKLNVYGEGSFFKAHVDTPRGGTMFGSLVVIYPTPHEGGSLIFRDGTNEWTFDSAQASKIGSATRPCVAYAIFYSDVEHEVARVTSGHRVTVTYNLHFIDFATPTKPLASLSAAELEHPHDSHIFESTLEQILQDESFLPEGGHLGFGLRRVYPLDKSSTTIEVPTIGWIHKPYQTKYLDLDGLMQFLKGSDADILHACTTLGLCAKLWLLYTDEDDDIDDDDEEDDEAGVKEEEKKNVSILLPCAPDIEGCRLEDSIIEELEQEEGAKRIRYVDLSKEDGILEDVLNNDEIASDNCNEVDSAAQANRNSRFDMEVHWVTKPSKFNVVKNSVIAYGNEPDIGYTYGFLSLIVQVGKPDARRTIERLRVE